MRPLLLAALALLFLTAPASADVTVHEPLPGDCSGTNGAYGVWGEAWVGSGHPTARGPCYVHVRANVDPPALDPDCVELEWDTGYTQFVCWAGGDPSCYVAVGEEDPGWNRHYWLCVTF